jgi:TP901 family phage tail tape measure protein
MATLESRLRVSLIDGVSARARNISGAINGLRRQASASFSPVGSLAGRLVAFGGAYLGVTEGLRGTAGAAMDFESAFADVQKVVDATDEQFGNMRNTIRQMSTQLPIASKDIAALFAAAGESGIATEDLKSFAEMAARVGIAFDMTAGQAGESLAKLKTQLGLSVAETGDMADAINHLSNNMASKASDITNFMLRVGALAEMGGFTKEQIAGIGSAMIAAGAEAETAGTAMQNVVKALTKGDSAKKGQRDVAKALGLNLPQIAKDMQKDAPKALRQVLNAIGKAPKDRHLALLSDFFGDEAKAFAPLIGNVKLLDQALDSVSDRTKYSGSAFKEYVARANTTANVLQLLRNKISDVGISIGDRMLPRIREAALGIGDVLDTLGERAHIFSQMDAATQGFLKGLGVDGGVREVINDLGDMLLGAANGSEAADKIGRIFAQFQTWGADIRSLSSAIADNPLAKLFADIAPYGFQLMLWGAGITFLAGTIRKLASAMFFLSGASTLLGAVKAVGTLAGLVGGGGAAAAGAGGTAATAAAVAGGSGLMAKLLGLTRASVLGVAGYGGAQLLDRAGTGKTFYQEGKALLPGVEDLIHWGGNALGGADEKGVPGWKRFLMGKAADPDFNAAQHFGAGGGGDKPVRIDASSIAEMTRPSGTQDVRVTNQQPPNIQLSVVQHITGVSDPQAAASQSGALIGAEVKSTVESMYSD